MSYTKSVYHIVFGTKNRYPAIPVGSEKEMYMILYNLMRKYGAYVYRIGGMPDHVHVLVDITSKYSLADFVKKLKQESSYLAGQNGKFPDWNGWAEGYAGFSYSINDIPTIMNYIMNQKEHHRVKTFAEEYREWLSEMGCAICDE